MENPNKKKVVVLGGAGFLGSHTADALSDAGYQVTIFDIRQSRYLRPDQTMIVGSIENKEILANALKDADIVFHYAGIADLKESMQKPYETMQANVLGTVSVLEACRFANVKRFVFASSLYVYSSSGSYYRISKLAAELIIEEFCKKIDLEYTILRYGSLYGPRSDLRNGIHRLVHQAITQNKITYFGTEHDVREYIHISQAAHLSVQALADSYANQSVILSGSQALTSKQLLTIIAEMLGKEITIEILPPQTFINYSVTPYTFSPRIAKKMITTEFIDIGEGVLRLIEEIYHKENRESEPNIRAQHDL